MSEVSRVTLIDRDIYESANLRTQDIVPSDVRKPKALVQARRLRRINPSLQVEAIVGPVENVPLGRFRSNLILAGLDSRRARQVVNERAWQVRTPAWIDAGVDGEGLLARVSVYFPGPRSACGICDWGQEQFDDVETPYPCTNNDGGGHDAGPPATNAASYVGSLAASLLAIESRKILADSNDPVGKSLEERNVEGREILVDAGGGNLYSTKLTYNPDCVMPDHISTSPGEPFDGVDVVSNETRIGEVIGPSLRPTKGGVDGADAIRLRVIGQSFVTGLTCPKCGDRRPLLNLKASLSLLQRHHCPRCDEEMVATGVDTVDELQVDSLSPRTLSRALNSIGIRPGDMLRLGYSGGGARTIEIDSEDDRTRDQTYTRYSNDAHQTGRKE
jgi:hypothetical protein